MSHAHHASMDIIVLRHATAADGHFYGEDSDRPLTRGGRHEAATVAASLVEHGQRVDLMVVSPYVRAVQTAEIVAQAIGYDEQVQVTRRLVPESNAASVISSVIEPAIAAGVTRLLICGHEPLLGGLLSFLLQRKGIRPGRAHCIALRYLGPTAKQAGQLLWVVTPDHPAPVQSLDVP